MAMPRDQRKDSLRASVLLARAAVSPQTWEAEDTARDDAVLDWLGTRTPTTLALYISRPGEPATRSLIDTLHALDWKILLPVLRREPDWAWFSTWEQTTPSWGDIPEPTTPRLGPAALAAADVILVPCLAVGRDGSRLGTGGGWYDRALAWRRSDAPLVALSRADEVFDTVPHLAHDLAVDAHITEQGSSSSAG